MKKLYYILVSFLFLILFSSCSFEENISGFENEEDLPVELKLKIGLPSYKIETRANDFDDTLNSLSIEPIFYNIYLYIFDSNGDLHDTHFFNEPIGLKKNSSGVYSDGTLKFNTTTVKNATIVAIANIETDTVRTGFGVKKADLDKIKKYKDLNEYVVYTNNNVVSVYNKSAYLMTAITFGDISKKVESTNCRLTFHRVEAKVEFIFKTDPANPDWKNFEFRADYWKVMRVPEQSYLLNDVYDSRYDYDGPEAQYFDTEYQPVTKDIITPYNESELGFKPAARFIFYMPENIKSPKEEIPEKYTGAEAYSLREKKNPSGGWQYANGNSTYVITKGNLSYIDENQKSVTSDITLTVHLGNGFVSPNDYNTYRNRHYRYIITVRGVNDILMEVVGDDQARKNEVRPGYEGNVYYNTNNFYEVDAHYDRAILRFFESEITDDLTWSVKTPFSEGVYTGDNLNSLLDYKWIKFAINSEYGFEKDKNGKLVRYPGDQNYDDPFIDNDGVSTPLEVYADYPNARLMDVHQLINTLKANKTELFTDKNRERNPRTDQWEPVVYVTAFIDEYLYKYNPTQNPYVENLSLWKMSVKASPRYLSITSDIKYSQDGASSVVSNSLYTFRQLPITTVYNYDKMELKTALGAESILDAGRLPLWHLNKDNIGSGHKDDLKNGRKNSIALLEGYQKNGSSNLLWADFLSDSYPHRLNDPTDYGVGNCYVNYVCILANRDHNGDGIVDPEEIQWYLPAIAQYWDLYIGESALAQSQRLYPEGSIDWSDPKKAIEPFFSYASSTFMISEDIIGSNYRSMIFPAEEGAGTYIQSPYDENIKGNKYSYKCVRNLGIPDEDYQTLPENLVTVSEYNPDNNTYLFDMSNLNPQSVRPNSENSFYQPFNQENSPWNRPYKKFEAKAGFYPEPTVGIPEKETNYDFTNELHFINIYLLDDYYCPSGYRPCNARELMIMSIYANFGNSEADANRMWPTYSPEEEPSIILYPRSIARTHFSRNSSGDIFKYRYCYIFERSPQHKYFYLNSSVLNEDDNTMMADEQGYIRCVRDVD